MRKSVLIFAVFILLSIVSSSAFAQSPQISSGLSWLNSAQTTTGNWSSVVTDEYCSTATALDAAYVLEPSSSVYTTAFQWMSSQIVSPTDYLARRIIALKRAGLDTSAELDGLLLYRNSSGSWGVTEGFDGNVFDIIDTTLALQALKAVNYADYAVLFQAINYLATNQNADGGWGLASGSNSNVYMTATVLKALSLYKNVTFNVQSSIDKAVAYLLSKQNPDGGFGSSPSNAYETALSIISLTESGPTNIQPLQNAINYLTTTQLSDGSWNDDPYYTALALQALAKIKPNLSISSTDIAFSKPMPQTGESITITAVIKNTGLENTSGVVVRFYQGDPSAGGTQIGTDQVIQLIALGSSSTASVTTVFTGTGSRTLFVVADPDNLISETSKLDNRAMARLWVATGADLAVFSEDLKPSTYTPASGTAFTLQYTIRNLGESATGAFDVALYDGNPSGTPIQTAHISGIDGTGVRTGTIGVTLTGDGPHTLYVVADSGNAITELSKTNNTGSVTVNVGGTATGADLVITSSDITLIPARPHAGDTVTIVANVRNQGTQSADNFTVELFDGAPESGGVPIFTQTLSLAAGAEQSVTAGYAVPSGIHDLYVVLDRMNTVIETNEANNRAMARLMTDMIDISLSATDLTFNPSRPVVGDTVVFSIIAHNQGIANTGPFNLALYDGDPKAGGTLLQAFPISNIPGDGSSTVTYTFIGQAKTYQFYAVADPDNVVVEMYEDNNTAIRSLTIKNPGELLGPDLAPVKIDLSDTTTDPQTLAIIGTAHVTLQNKGDDKIITPFDVIIFEDRDGDARYTAGIDNLVSTGTNTITLWPEGASLVDAPLSGAVKFLRSPLYAFVDSGDSILEQNEANNLLVSCKDCEVVPTNPIQPVVKWRWRRPQADCHNWSVILQPVAISPLIDTNGDGKVDEKDDPFLLFVTNEAGYCVGGLGVLHAVNGKTGAQLFEIHGAANRTISSEAFVAVGDIDNDGLPEIIIIPRNPQGTDIGWVNGIQAYKNDGTLLWDNWDKVYAYDKANRGRYQAGGGMSTTAPVIADLDGDGKPEIIVGPTAFNGDGSVKWGYPVFYYWTGQGWPSVGGGMGPSRAAVADIDLDGKQEILAGNTAYNADGAVKWWNKALPDGNNTVVNFNDDPYPEVLYGTGVGAGGTGIRIYLLDHQGSIIWGPVYLKDLEPAMSSINDGTFVIADFDGDGETEIGIKGYSNYIILDRNGTLKKMIPMPWGSANMVSADTASPAVFDLNGDGRPEVISNVGPYFSIHDGKEGTLLYQEGFGGYLGHATVSQNVVVSDLDRDGHADIIAYGLYGMNVYSALNNDWVGARSIWNQYDYHVTNVNDDGSIPQHEAPSWLLNNTYRAQAAIGANPNPYLTPNLTASYLRASQNGTNVELTIRIGNGGAREAASGMIVTFYDGVPSLNIVIGTAATTRTLQPGEYQDIILSVNSLGVGLHHIYAVADSANAISECDETDNQTFLDFTVLEGFADLLIGPEDITLPPAPYYEGSIIPITAGVRNQGSVTASNVTVKLFLGSPTSGGVQIGIAQTIPAIITGGSTTVAFTFDTLGKSGTNVLYLVLDQENTIVESNETNNQAAVTIIVQEPALPNLAVTTENIQLSPASPQEGQAVTITALVINRGAAVGNIPVKISVRSQESGVSSQELGTRTIYPVLSLGQTATVTATLDTAGLSGQQTVFVTIDPLNTITESSKTDNSASKSLFIQSAGLASSLTLDKTAYQRDETMTATITVSNALSQPRNLSLNLAVIDSAGNLIATIANAEPVTIGPNSAITLSKTWNIGTTLSGQYVLTTETTENGNVVSRTSAGFSITQDKAIDAKVTTDKISYNPNETAALTSTVASQSPNTIMENLTARVTVKSQESGVSSALYTDTKTITTLMPGAVFTFKTYWNTGTYAPGTYPVTLEVRDVTGAIIATGTRNIVISTIIKPTAVLRGTISVDKQSIMTGETVTASYSLTNIGNSDLADLALSVLTVDVKNQTIYNTLASQATLTMGATYTNTGTINTTSYSAKDYLVVLRANINGTEETIAGAYFRVEGAPTAPSLSSPAQGADVLTFTPALIVNNAADPNDDKLTYQFELYTDSGLTNLIGASGLFPAGPGMTSWQIPIPLQENTAYSWRARAYDGKLYGPWMTPASFRVNTVNDAPTAPVISSPADGASVDTYTPALAVTNAFDPDSFGLTYNYDVALDPGFTQLVASTTGVRSEVGGGTTSWTVPANLTENQTYYWRSQADDWFMQGPWSTTGSFFVNTANDAPTTPVVISPANGSTLAALETDITIANSTDPDSSVITYFIEADTATTFDSPNIIRSGGIAPGQPTTLWHVTGLQDNTLYYVRVKASDGSAESPWSTVNSFFANTANDAPAAPVLANPSNGAGVNVFTPTLSIRNATDPDRDALTYEFQVYADSGMTVLVAASSGVISQESGATPAFAGAGLTSWTVPVTLTENQTYYWRARAYDGTLNSNWMTTASFTVNTANDAPTAPTLSSPTDGESVPTLNPVLAVQNATDPDSDSLTYDFEVYSGEALVINQSGVSSQESGTTSWTVTTPLTDNTVYTWRARAYDGDRYSAWTNTAGFTVHIPVTAIGATINFDPDTLNKASNGTWVVVYIELPAGYNPADIDISTIRLEGTIPAEPRPYAVGDRDKDGIPDLMVKFKRSEVINLLPVGDNVTVHVTGKVGAVTFEGVDVIRVRE